MKKSVLTIGILVIIVAIVGGVLIFKQNDNNKNLNTYKSTVKASQTAETAKKEQTNQLTVDSAIEKLKNAGLAVSSKQGAYYQAIGASNGDKVDVNNINIELYEFDNSGDTTAAKQQLDDDSSTTFTLGNFLVLIHSTDASATQPIENALRG